MIAIRRFLALILVLPFVLLFVATLLVFRINGTFLEPGFYVSTLERLDAYQFIYDEVIPEALADTSLAQSDNALGLTSGKLVGYLETALPPAWLQQQTDAVLNAVVPYLNGSQDAFSVTIRLDDRVQAVADVVREGVADAGLYDYLMDEAVRPAVEEQRTALATGLPLGISLTPEQVMTGVRTIVTQEWLAAEVNALLDELVPYAVGQTDTFGFTLPLQDRAEVGLEVLRGWLTTSDGTRDYLLSDVLAPAITSGLAGAGTLPLGVSITDAEVVAALEPVLTDEWLDQRLNDAFAVLGPYLIGQVDDFTLVVPLGAEAAAAAAGLVGAIDAKYEALYASLPTCTSTFASATATNQLLALTLPSCAPEIAGVRVPYSDVRSLLPFDTLTSLTSLLAASLPAEVTLTKTQLLGTFAASGAATGVEQVRAILRDGYRVDTARLESMVNEQLGDGSDGSTPAWEQVQKGRGYLRDGITFTQDDLWGTANAPDLHATVDDVRGYVGQGRSLLFLLILLPLLFAVIIGVLGGRTWGSRLAWGAFPVLVGGGLLAGTMFAVSGPLSGLLGDVITRMDAPAVATAKLLELREALVGAFVSPLRLQGIIAAAGALVLMVVGIVLSGQGKRKAA